MNAIPVNEPLLTGNERRYLNECLDTGWISSDGPFVSRFESAFSRRVDRCFGIAVSNGSAALEITLKALGLGPGDEVLLPAFTIISPAAAIVRCGAKPVLIDSDPLTWNMDIRQIEARLTPRTRAILVVHIYGLPVDMDPLLKLAEAHGLWVVEDAAEMHGQTYKGRPCGSFGHAGIFSFYANKHVTTGEGGMIVADDEGIAERCRSYRNLCFGQTQRFRHEDLGWNCRMTNMQAALGCAQLERLDEFVQRKRRMGAIYTRLLADVPGIRLPLEKTDYGENIYWVYGIVLGPTIPFTAEEARRRLENEGIGTRPFFWPMHEQPVFQGMGLFREESYPVAENLARRGFYIPSGLALTDEQIEQVAAALHRVIL